METLLWPLTNDQIVSKVRSIFPNDNQVTRDQLVLYAYGIIFQWRDRRFVVSKSLDVWEVTFGFKQREFPYGSKNADTDLMERMLKMES